MTPDPKGRPSLVQHYLERSARRFPEKRAVIDENESITYGELNRRSDQLARFLAGKGLSSGGRAVILIPKSILCITAFSAVLKAGGVYVPLDDEAPVSRLRQILRDAEPEVLLCVLKTWPSARRLASGRKMLVVCLDGPLPGSLKNNGFYDQKALLRASSKGRLHRRTSLDLAYLLYTSGSTGRPKGVMIRHANVIDFIEWAAPAFGLKAGDRVAQFTPFVFDLSVFDLYGTFRQGATLILISREISLFGEKILQAIEREKITVWFSVPSLLVQMLKSAPEGRYRLRSLKAVIFGGEIFPPLAFSAWKRRYRHPVYYNIYGPSEATVMVTRECVTKAPKPPQTIPIGKACGHAGVFVLKDDGAFARPGEEGELWVSGSAVAAGYWKDPVRTRQFFVKDPRPGRDGRVFRTGDRVRVLSGGRYLFLGRKDFQIKFRGHRIELGDVERQFLAIPGVEEAAVLAVRDAGGSVSGLRAFIKMNKTMDRQSLLARLRARLPLAMIPREIHEMKRLPRTRNGKLDRQKLSVFSGMRRDR